jgi:hypothetical protein
MTAYALGAPQSEPREHPFWDLNWNTKLLLGITRDTLLSWRSGQRMVTLATKRWGSTRRIQLGTSHFQKSRSNEPLGKMGLKQAGCIEMKFFTPGAWSAEETVKIYSTIKAHFGQGKSIGTTQI